MFQAEKNIFKPIKPHLRFNLACTTSIWVFKRLNLVFKKPNLTFKTSILNKFVHKYRIWPNSTIKIGLCYSKFRNLNEFEWIRPSLVFSHIEIKKVIAGRQFDMPELEVKNGTKTKTDDKLHVSSPLYYLSILSI